MEDEDEIRYSVSAPVDVRTKDVSDTLKLVAGGNVVVRWEEKRFTLEAQTMNHSAIIITLLLPLCETAPSASAATGSFEQTKRPTVPPGWSETLRQTLDLTVAGKHTEVIAIMEKWVAKYPNFVEARAMLGAAHENIGRDIRTSGARDAALKSVPHYEAAVQHFRRALELPGAGFDEMRALIDIHGLIALNRPTEFERLVREAVKRYPAEPGAHAYLIALVAGNEALLEEAARAALVALPKGADARADLAGFLYQSAKDPLQMSADAVLRTALRFADEALKIDPAHKDAIREKARIVDEQARQNRLRKPGV